MIKVLQTTHNYILSFVHPLLAKLWWLTWADRCRFLNSCRASLYQSSNNKKQLCQRLCYYMTHMKWRLQFSMPYVCTSKSEECFFTLFFTNPCHDLLVTTNLNLKYGAEFIPCLYFTLLFRYSGLNEFHKYVLANRMPCAALICTS
jgi:hypothetical protein